MFVLLEKIEIRTQFWCRNLKRKGHVEEEKQSSQMDLREYGVRVEIGLNWPSGSLKSVELLYRLCKDKNVEKHLASYTLAQ
jgi:hypothetical protein